MLNQETIDSVVVDLEHEVALSSGGQTAAVAAIVAVIVIITH